MLKTPVAIGADLPALTVEAPLTPQQRAALEEDLKDLQQPASP